MARAGAAAARKGTQAGDAAYSGKVSPEAQAELRAAGVRGEGQYADPDDGADSSTSGEGSSTSSAPSAPARPRSTTRRPRSTSTSSAPARPRPAPALGLPGGSGADSGASFVLGLLVWGWLVLPFLRGGMPEVRKTIRAKFVNKAPDGTWLP